ESTPNGRTLSVARDAGIPSIYLEFGGGTGFRKQVVKAYVSGFFNFLKSVKMIEGEPELLSTEKYYWVEDARLDSGYLQGKMPSPRSEEHTSELQSRENLVCRLLLEKKNKKYRNIDI